MIVATRKRRTTRASWLVVLAIFATGCTAGRAYRMGGAAMKSGDWDQAVAYYRTATNASPDNANYKIALQRALLSASRAHFEKAREFEAKEQLEAARGEYQLAAEYDPSNRQAAARVAALEQTIRSRIEAARPRPAIEQLRERARSASAEPLLNPASRDPISMRFPNTNIREILDTIGGAAGINIVFDPAVPQTPVPVVLNGVTFEQALQQIMTVNQLSYKVLSERSILVFPDNGQKHGQYDDQVVQTFYVTHADATELAQILLQVVRMPQMAIQPAIQPNKATNTITVRATASVAQIIERVIAQIDKAKAEIVVDVEILEVNRSRTKQYGLNLTEYALGIILSPEVAPVSAGSATITTGADTATGTVTRSGTSTPPSGVTSPPPFNLNTLSRGLTTADWYLAVPAAIVNFLESDTQTKVIAKPQLRGSEGSKMTLKLGDSIPVVSTSYTPIATGGVGINPLSSYTYRDIGVNIELTPRVTPDNDIIMDLMLDNSSLGANIAVAGVTVPSFGQRTLTTRLRLRDGESNLLAGLLKEDDRRSLRGVPGAVSVPILRDLFSSNDKTISQTDIVMLLTPHIVRSMNITEADLRPLFIGSQGALGIGGPPPLIASPDAAPAAPTTPPALAVPVPGGVVVAPPGSSPVPGTIFVPTQPPPATPPPTAAPPPPNSPPGGANAAPTTPAADPNVAPLTTQGLGVAQITVTPPAGAIRVGGGPYTVPISIANAARLSTITLTLTFDPSVLRVRAVNEGGFMRSGGASATFAQQVGTGRVDFTITRSSDAVGASGQGLLGSVLFDAIAPGNVTLSVSGAGTGPGGTTMGLQFRPVTVLVQP